MTDFEWLTVEMPRLRKKHGDQYVGIVDRKVVGVGKTPSEALSKARKSGKVARDKRPLIAYLGVQSLGF
jgi:hypothetical protein